MWWRRARRQASPAGAVAVERWGRAVVRAPSRRRRSSALDASHAGGFYRPVCSASSAPDGRAQLSDAQRRELDAWEALAVLIGAHPAVQPRGRGAGCRRTRARPDGAEPRLSVRWRLIRPAARAGRSQARSRSSSRRAGRGSTPSPTRSATRMPRPIQARLAVSCSCLTFPRLLLLCDVLLPWRRERLLIVYSVLYVADLRGIPAGAPGAGIRSVSSTTGRSPRRCGSRSIGGWWASGCGPSDVKADAPGEGSNVDADTVGVLADAYPIKQPSELAWVKICLRTLELLDRAEGVADERVLDPVCHGIVRRCWVRSANMCSSAARISSQRRGRGAGDLGQLFSS